MSPRPDGLVDPTAVSEVAAVLDAVQRTMGVGGIADLLGRLPGVRLHPGSPKRFFSPAVPATVWVGPEDRWILGDGRRPVERVQSVAGVVLHREAVPPGRLGELLAGQIVRLTHDQGCYDEAAVVLSGARDAAGP